MADAQQELGRRTILKQIATITALGMTTARAEPSTESETQSPASTQHPPARRRATRRAVLPTTQLRATNGWPKSTTFLHPRM